MSDRQGHSEGGSETVRPPSGPGKKSLRERCDELAISIDKQHKGYLQCKADTLELFAREIEAEAYARGIEDAAQAVGICCESWIRALKGKP